MLSWSPLGGDLKVSLLSLGAGGSCLSSPSRGRIDFLPLPSRGTKEFFFYASHPGGDIRSAMVSPGGHTAVSLLSPGGIKVAVLVSPGDIGPTTHMGPRRGLILTGTPTAKGLGTNLLPARFALRAKRSFKRLGPRPFTAVAPVRIRHVHIVFFPNRGFAAVWEKYDVHVA